MSRVSYRISREGLRYMWIQARRNPKLGLLIGKVIVKSFVDNLFEDGIAIALLKFYREAKELEEQDGMPVEHLLELVAEEERRLRDGGKIQADKGRN